MSNAWRQILLADVAAELTVGHVGPMVSEYVDVGVPFLRSKNVHPFEIDWEDIRHELHRRLKKSALWPGDVVIVRTGKPGAAAIIPDSLGEANCSDLVIVRTGPELDSRFLVYYLNSLASHHINSHLVGAVQQLFNVGSARNLRMNRPDFREQRAIASILGALDDKIELNRRMNETLEAMARAIFKSWFVDFDPVRAKMDGRQPPGMDADTARLFPDSFARCDFGLVPKGWRIESVGGLIALAYGKALKADVRVPGDIPVYGSNGQVGWHDKKLVDGPGIVVGRKGNPGIVTWSQTEFFPIDTTFYVIAKGAVASLQYLFFALDGQNLANLGADSAVPGLNRNLAYMNQMLVPPMALLRRFDSHLAPLRDHIHANNVGSRSLTALRDALLPKLLSGEIRVGEAERVVGEVV